MRVFGAALVAVAVVTAFAIGRETSTSSSRVAEAQVPPFTHFQCYLTTTPTTFKPVPVLIKDQFGVMKAALQRPNLFCAPANKRLVSGEPHTFAGAADHLLCYPEDLPGKSLLRKVENQLGVTVIRNLQPRWLCLPTHKYEPASKGG